MAHVRTDDTTLVVALTPLERVLALRRRVAVPLSAVRQVDVLDDVIHQVHGLRPSQLKLIGSYLPGRLAVGSFLAGGQRPAFIAARRSPSRGLRITPEGAKYSQLIIGLDDPEDTRQRIVGQPT
jgi:hypothetical protein